MKKLDWLLLAFVAALILLALTKVKSPEGHQEVFSSADRQAARLIAEINPSYKPWWRPFWEPPSGEVESLLFALQAAIGAGVVGYFLGSRATLKRMKRER